MVDVVTFVHRGAVRIVEVKSVKGKGTGGRASGSLLSAIDVCSAVLGGLRIHSVVKVRRADRERIHGRD